MIERLLRMGFHAPSARQLARRSGEPCVNEGDTPSIMIVRSQSTSKACVRITPVSLYSGESCLVSAD